MVTLRQFRWEDLIIKSKNNIILITYKNIYVCIKYIPENVTGKNIRDFI